MGGKACLAEVYLTMAGWPLKQTQYYADARDKAFEIIEDGVMILLITMRIYGKKLLKVMIKNISLH